ncbi:Isochorismatase hydrolase [Hypoxylon trugodes]|uniref:Isochorismatase hydrolase n=1 Tax=Hypoxylon trugodes TaxID=326681 RepID=UPI0021A24BD2|nr:Isochorismatase hydrolase [Hypoxylon trugodes]KAI1393570.1 Isochorismatase hydrolase [Hypoxylon trugodes]
MSSAKIFGKFAFARGLRPRPITTSSLYLHRRSVTIDATTTMESGSRLRHKKPAIFVCDLQDKFRNAIHQFDKVVLTTQKVLRAAKILNIPVFATTQIAAKLGATVPEIQKEISASAVPYTEADKTAFSMLGAAEISSAFPVPGHEIVIVGIESHICVTQTSLDLLARGHKVYVLADGVSSCNPQEIPIALARLRSEGAIVTTSESWLYECMGDASIPEFREIAKLVKETGADTKAALAGLLGDPST